MLMNVCHVREGYGSGAMTVSTELHTLSKLLVAKFVFPLMN